MEQSKKNIMSAVLIFTISLLLILGIVKMAQAPLSQALFILERLNINSAATQNPLPVQEEKPIELIFGGDVMLSRQVNTKIQKFNDYSWPFIEIADYLKNADLTIVNLESPFLISKNYSVETGSFSFKANPESIIGLTISGIDLVTLANNHILNQGAKGISDTIRILGDQEIKSIGAGENENKAHQGEIIFVRGQKFAFLSYAYPDDYSVAETDKAGIADMNIEKMKNDIKRLKDQKATVIILMHAGNEYVKNPNQQQINFAHAAIDSGAEAVIGHHPHRTQTFEFYKDKPIIYSLGNLVFDQMWSIETRRGLLAKMTWKNGWQKIELVPIKIYDYGQAEILADEPERKNILNEIGAPDDGLIKSE